MRKISRIAPELKEQILNRIRTEGITAVQVAKEHGVNVHTIYGWLKTTASISPNILRLNKLKRENEELQRLLGKAMMEIERSKKNQSRYAV
jgi:transposase-like protein